MPRQRPFNLHRKPVTPLGGVSQSEAPGEQSSGLSTEVAGGGLVSTHVVEFPGLFQF